MVTEFIPKESLFYSKAGSRILVVDDDGIQRFMVREWLEQAGYVVEEASDGMEALKILDGRGGEFKAMLTDILMPKLDGIALLKETLRLYPCLACVIMSASVELNTAISALKMGACDYITKPFSSDILLVTMERAVQKKDMEQQLDDYRQNLEKRVKDQTDVINMMYVRSVDAMVKALEAKDFYTRGHSQRVMIYSIAIARELGIVNQDIEDLQHASVLHDIGKIGIRESVINKPGPLTSEEFQEITRHPELSAGILEPIPFLKPLLSTILHHHEWFNGSGYPSGLAGDEIPLGSRVMSVADTFDAMTSTRPYRKALPADDAITELRYCAGKQFDPNIVKTFISCLPRIIIPAGVRPV